MSNFQKLRNRFVLCAASTSIIGAICWLSPNSFVKGLGNFLGYAGIGGLAVSQMITDESEKIADKSHNSFYISQNQLKLELSKVENNLIKVENNLIKVGKENQKLKTGLNEYMELAAKQQEDLKYCALEVEKIRAENKSLIQDFKQVMKLDSTSVVEVLNQSLTVFNREIEGLLTSAIHHYPELEEKFSDLKDKVFAKACEFEELIQTIATHETFEDIAVNAIQVQHDIIYHLSVVKAHIYNAQIRVLRKKLEEMIPFEEHEQVLDSTNAAWFQKYHELRGNLESIRQEFSTTADQVIQAYKTDFNEMVGMGLSDTERIAALQNEILRLQQEIVELKKPLKWSLAQSRELKIGNLIIEYFWQTGIYLDRTHSQGDVYSVKLYFQIDRNSRAIAPKELNEHSNYLVGWIYK